MFRGRTRSAVDNPPRRPKHPGDISQAAPLPAGPPIDVSVTIRPRMPIYEGNPVVSVELAQAIVRGDAANVSRLELGSHTGTHVDAPRHFIPGAATVDE